ncbi:hypothetical protein DPX16_8751 [Anabarilius grahami]|uniref:Uncharacterized protein n=1 Tax=Anabarilius grahami TaxID=495550 RepID=A0A3N0YDM2_ANAGA|nr:hypothetical protein DPX16_8751 [Anabarilius grahami]
MVLAVHQREREGGDTTQSAVMGNKDAFLRYAGLFPDMVAAISECRVREGTGTPAQEDQVLVGFGNFATISFKDLYDATDRDRKGFIKWVRKQTARPGLFPDMVAAISERRVREGTGTPAQEDQVLVGFGNFAAISFKDLYEATDRDRKGFVKWVRKQTARPVATSSSASAEEPSDEDLLAAAAHVDVPADATRPPSQPEPLPSATRAAASEQRPLPTEDLLLPEGWRQTLPKEQHLWVSKALFTRDKSY